MIVSVADAEDVGKISGLQEDPPEHHGLTENEKSSGCVSDK